MDGFAIVFVTDANTQPSGKTLLRMLFVSDVCFVGLYVYSSNQIVNHLTAELAQLLETSGVIVG